MRKQRWLVRERLVHGLISVDEFDLVDCPAPLKSRSGPCLRPLSEQFEVVRAPKLTLAERSRFSASELSVLDWLVSQGGSVQDPSGQLCLRIGKALRFRKYWTVNPLLRRLRIKGAINYEAAPGRGTTSVTLLVDPGEIETLISSRR